MECCKEEKSLTGLAPERDVSRLTMNPSVVLLFIKPLHVDPTVKIFLYPVVALM
jgi:hypothetical protein